MSTKAERRNLKLIIVVLSVSTIQQEIADDVYTIHSIIYTFSLLEKRRAHDLVRRMTQHNSMSDSRMRAIIMFQVDTYRQLRNILNRLDSENMGMSGEYIPHKLCRNAMVTRHDHFVDGLIVEAVASETYAKLEENSHLSRYTRYAIFAVRSAQSSIGQDKRECASCFK